MGANFYVACHKCREVAFCLRDFESVGEVLTRFFNKHYDRGKLKASNVQVAWDYFEELPWMEEDRCGYRDATSDLSPKYKRLVEMYPIEEADKK